MTASALTGVYMFAIMIGMIMIGFPLYVSLLLPTFLGFYLVGGLSMVEMQFMTGPFVESASYTFAVVPLFMVVGVLAGESGIASGAYTSMKKWLGGLRGGLLYATVAANTVFGACSGMSTAGNVVFTKIALPELDKEQYEESLSLGCITAAGSLSVLIPPSIPIILFCILTGTSIGHALVCGTSAGLLLTVLMFALIAAISIFQPRRVPAVSAADKNVPLREKLGSLKLLLPIAMLFLLIVGGSFLGWFPATVGGAVAMTAIVIYAVVIKMPVRQIAHCIWEGTDLFVTFFLIIVAGQMFSRFISLSGLASQLVIWITGLHIGPYVLMWIVVVFYLICGCVMNVMPILVITIPVIYPLLTGLGFDPYALVFILIFCCEIGNLTPPVGMAVFVVAATAGRSPTTVFRGSTPFFILNLACIAIAIYFPNVFLWLPNLLGA